MFSTEIIKKAKIHAMTVFPQEAVGFVIDNQYEPQKNKAEDPLTSFSCDYPTDRNLKAVIHSHVKTEKKAGYLHPSEQDMRGQLDTNVPWGIILTDGSDCSEPLWWGNGVPVAPLIGRPFIHGVQDCYSLIRDYYRLEHKIELGDYPRDYEWWNIKEKNPDHYVKNFEKEGFYQIDRSDLQVGDCALIKIRSDYVNHAAIYVGDGIILHHLFNRLSKRDSFAIWANKYVTHYVRCGKLKPKQ